MPSRQVPTIVLPQVGSGLLTETVNNALVHYSSEFAVYTLQEKTVDVYCTLALGAPGPLNCWIEVAPYPLSLGAFYTVLGVPVVVAATGNIVIPWTAHSEYARLGVQAPGAGVAAFWVVFATFSGKGP